MKIVARPRGCGKTEWIVDRLMADPNAACVVASSYEADMLVRRLAGRGLNLAVSDPYAQVFTIRQFCDQGRYRIGHPGHLYVDELDRVLMELLGRRVDVATVTAELDVRYSPPSVPGPIGTLGVAR